MGSMISMGFDALLRLFLKMYKSLVNVLVCSTASSKAYNCALIIFGYPSRWVTMFIYNGSSNTHVPGMFSFPSALGIQIRRMCGMIG